MKSAFTLYSVYTDNMVFQRRMPIRLAGVAHTGAIVTAYLNNSTASVTVSESEEWVLELPAMEAGGPYTLRVVCDEVEITLSNILVGEVWLCSGQSNMEMFVDGPSEFYCLRNGKEVAAAANDPSLRLLFVDHGLSLSAPCTDLPGRPLWRPATTPSTVAHFSAIAYYFGTFLRQKLGIPVGIIDASWGGTNIEPWMPLFAFKNIARHDIISALSTATGTIELTEEQKKIGEIHLNLMQQELDKWFAEKFLPQGGETSQIALANWANPDFDDSTWQKGPFDSVLGLIAAGCTWYRIAIDTPVSIPDATLYLSFMNDVDQTFFDGKKIGQTLTDVPHSWQVERHYPIGNITPGHHTIAIRHMSLIDQGFIGDTLQILDAQNSPVIDLKSCIWAEKNEFWHTYAIAGKRPLPPSALVENTPETFQQTPTIICNAEVYPLTHINIAGVAWYQGCNNSERPDEYRSFQRGLINSWRTLWRNDKMPFIITQLSAFQTHCPENPLPEDWWHNEQPTDFMGWAPFRSMQEEFLDYPNTGVICTIDIGEASDIHPANKLDVGKRLANEAMRLAYDDANAIPCPRFLRAVPENGGIRVFFSNIQDGLAVDGGTFGNHIWSLASDDNHFVWANATLRSDNSVFVSSPSVTNPTQVRYAYTACPIGPFLRRTSDGLPLFPFTAKLN